MTTAPHLSPAIVPANDHARLQALAEALGGMFDPLGSLLQEKLRRADVREPDRIPGGTVALDRFVTFRIEGTGRHQRRLLIHPEDAMWPSAELSVASPLGIALLGLSTGDRAVIVGSAFAEPPWVEVLSVEPVPVGGFARRPSFARGVPSLTLADQD